MQMNPVLKKIAREFDGLSQRELNDMPDGDAKRIINNVLGVLIQHDYALLHQGRVSRVLAVVTKEWTRVE